MSARAQTQVVAVALNFAIIGFSYQMDCLPEAMQNGRDSLSTSPLPPIMIIMLRLTCNLVPISAIDLDCVSELFDHFIEITISCSPAFNGGTIDSATCSIDGNPSSPCMQVVYTYYCTINNDFLVIFR